MKNKIEKNTMNKNWIMATPEIAQRLENGGGAHMLFHGEIVWATGVRYRQEPVIGIDSVIVIGEISSKNIYLVVPTSLPENQEGVL